MNNRYDRLVVVTPNDDGLLIGFYWSEPEGELTNGVSMKFLEYPGKSIIASVLQAISRFVSLPPLLAECDPAMRISTAWADDKADLFDFIVDAEEPEQAFVSRYILEA